MRGLEVGTIIPFLVLNINFELLGKYGEDIVEEVFYHRPVKWEK